MRVHPALEAAATAARRAAEAATMQHHRLDLAAVVRDGADGTPTALLDMIVEDAILDAVRPLRVNVLSEEAGFIDVGSAETLVVDPVDGTGNLASGIPIACFTAAIAQDGIFVEGLTEWLATGTRWWAGPGEPHVRRTTGRTSLPGAIVSSIRPKGDAAGFLALARSCDRVRIFGCSSLEAAFVCDGRLDAFVDPGSDTHRIVDLAAALVLVRGTGGVVVDLHGRPLEFDLDVSRRWSGVVAATPALAAEICATIAVATTVI